MDKEQGYGILMWEQTGMPLSDASVAGAGCGSQRKKRNLVRITSARPLVLADLTGNG